MNKSTNETMLSVSLKAFDYYKIDELQFEQIFEYVKNTFDDKWHANNSHNYSDDMLYQSKRGELYKLLTIDGNFFRLPNGKWTNVRPTEFAKN